MCSPRNKSQGALRDFNWSVTMWDGVFGLAACCLGHTASFVPRHAAGRFDERILAVG